MSMDSNDSLKELCVICQLQPYDLVCTCGDKFDFTCIHSHVEQIGLEFEYIQNEVGQRLLNIEQIVDDVNCTKAKTIVENWKQKRIQDINDIAELALNEISQRENACSEVESLREKYNTLCTGSHRIVHEQLDCMVTIQQQIVDKSEELQNLSDLVRDDFELDLQLKPRLNPLIFKDHRHDEDIQSTSIPEDQPTITQNQSEEISSTPETPAIENPITTDSQLSCQPEISETNSDDRATDGLPENDEDSDEFEPGATVNIQRENPIILLTNNDRSLATICSYKKQLLYNDNSTNNQNPRLTFLVDLTQGQNKQFIDLTTSGIDDPWIQDITYSTKLQGYFLLNRTCLRLLSTASLQLDNFCQFPDRSVKRIACSEKFFYLIAASGINSRHGDEIVLFDYDKQEIICKTFRDIFSARSRYSPNISNGEISDIAVNNSEQIIFGYRIEHRREIGVFIYNISADGQNWTPTKQLLLNECWRQDVSFTPRIEWCERLQAFALVEHVTGHFILFNGTGNVIGEDRYLSLQNRDEMPMNLSFSEDGFLCIRYASSINIHKLLNNQS